MSDELSFSLFVSAFIAWLSLIFVIGSLVEADVHNRFVGEWRERLSLSDPRCQYIPGRRILLRCLAVFTIPAIIAGVVTRIAEILLGVG